MPKPKKLDLTGAQWRRSNIPAPAGENQVEAALVDGYVVVRDANNPNSPTLIFTPEEWDAFVTGAKNGDFN